MESAIYPADIVLALLLVKAVLATLAVLLFAYYKLSWEKAKKHVPVHFFFAKWRTVRHAIFLGFAAVGFAIGFSVELLGVQYGLDGNLARAASSVFETVSLLLLLYVFFTLAIEDVPSFQHISESARRAQRHARGGRAEPAMEAPAGKLKAQKKRGRKRAKKRTGKR